MRVTVDFPDIKTNIASNKAQIHAVFHTMQNIYTVCLYRFKTVPVCKHRPFFSCLIHWGVGALIFKSEPIFLTLTRAGMGGLVQLSLQNIELSADIH